MPRLCLPAWLTGDAAPLLAKFSPMSCTQTLEVLGLWVSWRHQGEFSLNTESNQNLLQNLRLCSFPLCFPSTLPVSLGLILQAEKLSHSTVR